MRQQPASLRFARRLLHLYQLSGFDPEAAANATAGMGVDKGAYPCSKKVVLGFNIRILIKPKIDTEYESKIFLCRIVRLIHSVRNNRMRRPFEHSEARQYGKSGRLLQNGCRCHAALSSLYNAWEHYYNWFFVKICWPTMYGQAVADEVITQRWNGSTNILRY